MTYILDRLLSIALTLFLISVITFAVTTILPGDVATMMMGTQSNPEALAGLRKSLGLNDPLIVQYGRWKSDVCFVFGEGARRRPRKAQRPFRSGHAEIRQPWIEPARHRHRILEAELLPGNRRSDLSLEISDHLAAFGRGVGDAKPGVPRLRCPLSRSLRVPPFPEELRSIQKALRSVPRA